MISLEEVLSYSVLNRIILLAASIVGSSTNTYSIATKLWSDVILVAIQ
jgi:hypothetical protein